MPKMKLPLTADEGRQLLIEQGISPENDNHHIYELPLQGSTGTRIRHVLKDKVFVDVNKICQLTAEEFLRRMKGSKFGVELLIDLKTALELMDKRFKVEEDPIDDRMSFARQIDIPKQFFEAFDRGRIFSLQALCTSTIPVMRRLGLTYPSIKIIRKCLWKIGTDFAPDSPFYQRTPAAEAIATGNPAEDVLVS